MIGTLRLTFDVGSQSTWASICFLKFAGGFLFVQSSLTLLYLLGLDDFFP